MWDGEPPGFILFLGNPDGQIRSDLEPELAMKLALGDVDPISLLPMEDINPGYVPRALKVPPLNLGCTDKGKTKKSASEGLLDFFSMSTVATKGWSAHHVAVVLGRVPKPKVTSPKRLSSSQPTKKTTIAGRESGKRTLTEVMDHDLAVKRKKLNEKSAPMPSASVNRRCAIALSA